MTRNILELSQALLDPMLDHELVETRDFNGKTYALIEQSGEYEAGLALIEIDGDNATRLSADLLSDPDAAQIDPAIIEGFSLGSDVLEEPAQDFDLPDLPGPITPLPGFDQILKAPAGPRLSQSNILRALHNLAIWGTTPDGQAEMNSRLKAPAATNRGRLACAWAVNRIARFALGKPVGGGLATAEMVKVLRVNDLRVSRDDAQPGAIIISPTQGGSVGHVGIMGEGDVIYSNSSNMGNWHQGPNFQRWMAYYGGEKRLPVEFYHLNPLRFSSSAFPVA